MAHMVMPRKAEPLQQGDILIVVHDFDARSADELTLRKSEKIELVELDDGFSDGWFLGRHLSRGMTGLFPAVYTTKLPTPPSARLSSAFNQPFNFATNSPPDLQPNYVPGNSPIYDNSTSPRPAPYQHKSEPILEEPPTLPEESNPYRQHAPQSTQRNKVPSYPTPAPAVPRSIGQALSHAHAGQDSPVMNETLNVIDEHITDLSAARQNPGPIQPHSGDSGSDYSAHADQPLYGQGNETDEDEENKFTQEEVLRWDHRQTADHLRKIGVDEKHCEIFEEQEITGDVLLDMDQSFLSMKEYDFGVMGRRLKTWHKIRDFQNAVLGIRPSRQSTLNPRASTESFSRTPSRVLSGGTILPRIPSLIEEPPLSVRQSQIGQPAMNGGAQIPPLVTKQSGGSINRGSVNTATPPTWKATASPGSPSRPSAASIRERGKSRRHSSMDLPKQSNAESSSTSLASTSTPLQKRSSLDQMWSLSNATPSSTVATTPSTNQQMYRAKDSLEMAADSVLLSEGPNLDLDRGYFSGNEVDNRKGRNLGGRKDNTIGSTQYGDLPLTTSTKKSNSVIKRHSRINSADSVRDPPNSFTSPASKIYHTMSSKGRFRSASARNASPKISTAGLSPTVTNLEQDRNSPLPPLPSPIPGSPYGVAMGSVSLKARKIMGIRAASEAVTENEKQTANSGSFIPGSLEESPEASPEGSLTPRSHSLDIDNTDSSSKNTDQIGSTLSSKPSSRTRIKTKQETSAYTRGLLHISPSEARQQCDYHGWMKKKSSSLITTWKPRLFILRGKRLSYYYSENDTQERGIIDISGHKILVANTDPVTTFHATITGATSPASPNPGLSSPDTSPVLTRLPNGNTSGPFYFKLVPPKAGMSRAVQFTRPTIHYFQADTAADGRKWMGEILKATIEHDLSSFETTNKQKTISLAKARARKERPPALKETESMPRLDTSVQSSTYSIPQTMSQSTAESLQPTPLSGETTAESTPDQFGEGRTQPIAETRTEVPIRENGLKIHGLGLVKGSDTMTLLEALRQDKNSSPAAEVDKIQSTST